MEIITKTVFNYDIILGLLKYITVCELQLIRSYIQGVGYFIVNVLQCVKNDLSRKTQNKLCSFLKLILCALSIAAANTF